MTHQELKIGPLSFRITDVLVLFTLALFTLLTLVFAPRIFGWAEQAGKNCLVAATFLVCIFLAGKAKRPWLRFVIRVVSVSLVYGYLFWSVEKLQLIIHGGWLDEWVLKFERAVFGIQPTLWLEQFTTPALTEWMMFSYMFYFLMYPIICGIIFFRHGETAMEDYFFSLGLTNILCDLGFILFPVAGPMYTVGHFYKVPLEGSFWTPIGEYVRRELQYMGGTIPSPHCAAATIMWAMAFRYHRPTFWFLTPLVLSLYVSTFYGRYHYLSDAIVGIAVAFFAIRVVPNLTRVWERALRKPVAAEVLEPVTTTETVR